MNIDLTDYIANLKLLEGRIEDAETEMRAAKSNLAARQKSTKEQLTTLLNQGETTGNSLQDSLIRIFGLDMERIKKILDFNEMLKQKKGQYLLITCCYKERTMITFTGHGDRDETRCRFYIGKLNGNEIQIIFDADKKHTEIIIPVDMYVTNENDKNTRKIGQLCLMDDFVSSYKGKVSMMDFLWKIGNPELNMDINIQVSDFEGESVLKIPPVGVIFKKIKTLLESPTPTEIIAGADI